MLIGMDAPWEKRWKTLGTSSVASAFFSIKQKLSMQHRKHFGSFGDLIWDVFATLVYFVVEYLKVTTSLTIPVRWEPFQASAKQLKKWAVEDEPETCPFGASMPFFRGEAMGIFEDNSKILRREHSLTPQKNWGIYHQEFHVPKFPEPDKAILGT